MSSILSNYINIKKKTGYDINISVYIANMEKHSDITTILNPKIIRELYDISYGLLNYHKF